MNRKDLRTLTLVGTTRDNLVLDLLAILHLATDYDKAFVISQLKTLSGQGLELQEYT